MKNLILLYYSNMSISNEPNQRWYRLLKANVCQENPVLRHGLGHFSNVLIYGAIHKRRRNNLGGEEGLKF